MLKLKRLVKTQVQFLIKNLEKFVPADEYKGAMKGKEGKYGFIGRGLTAVGSSASDYALTMGGMPFTKDEKTGDINFTDSYDFLNQDNTSKNGKFKKDWVNLDKKEGAQKEFLEGHNKLTEYDLKRKDIDGLAARGGSYKISAQDTVGTGKRKKETPLLTKLLKSFPKIDKLLQ